MYPLAAIEWYGVASPEYLFIEHMVSPENFMSCFSCFSIVLWHQQVERRDPHLDCQFCMCHDFGFGNSWGRPSETARQAQRGSFKVADIYLVYLGSAARSMQHSAMDGTGLEFVRLHIELRSRILQVCGKLYPITEIAWIVDFKSLHCGKMA